MRGRGRLEAAPSPLIALALPPGGQRRDPRALQALGPTQVLIKRGEHGASGVDGELELEVPAYRVDVVDTVGAGDAFAAGFLAGILTGLSLTGSLARGHRIATRALVSTRDHVD